MKKRKRKVTTDQPGPLNDPLNQIQATYKPKRRWKFSRMKKLLSIFSNCYGAITSAVHFFLTREDARI
jgi:hypothetical protein